MGMISANYGKFFVLLYYGERCTHIWCTSFLLQNGYDFGQLWKIFSPSILRGTVYTHLVHTVPLTIWVWFRPIMENFVLLYYGERCTHIWCTSFLLQYRYDFGQLWKIFVLLCYGQRCTHIWYTPFLLQYRYDFGQLWKVFVLLYYGERCTHIWYTPFLLQYGYDFGQLWIIFGSSIIRGTVYTHLVHTVPLTIWVWFLPTMENFCPSILRGTVYTQLVHTVPLTIWVWFRPIMENFLYFYNTGNGVHTFGTHRSSCNMGMISANYGKFFLLL